METYDRSHLSNGTLVGNAKSHCGGQRAATAALLAEIDARKLYRPAAYPSMYAWCMVVLGMREQSAFKHIRVARTARRFPAILPAIADGRLDLTVVILMRPHLTEATAGELFAAAANRTRAHVERLLAERFPQPDLPTCIIPLEPHADAAQFRQLSPGTVATIPLPQLDALPDAAPSPTLIADSTPAPMEVFIAPRIDLSLPPVRVKPLAPERVGVQLTVSRATHERLCYAHSLLSHQIAPNDFAGLLDRLLDLAIPQLEKEKFGATDHPRQGHGPGDTRHVPLEVKRAVWMRDGGQCTFVSDTGHRCEARDLIEFDHLEAFARGGQATAAGIRLLCRAHNQYEAERTFGAEFMRHRRLAATEARARTTSRRNASAATDARTASAMASGGAG
jgi:hypothetical protein